MDLVAFLNARLDEDEAAAAACESAPDPAASWSVLPVPERGYNLLMSDSDGSVVICGPGFVDDADVAHIARWDPARVLREVEAKRRIVAEHVDDGCSDLTYHRILEMLAAVWSDHPDYDQAWT